MADTSATPSTRFELARALKTNLVDRQSARLLFTHGGLLLRVVRNDLRARYAGSLLGIAWSVITPLLILGIYAAVYLFVFKIQRVAGLSPFQYVMFIFSGLVPFLATGEALSVGTTSVIADKALLTNTVFPIDLVPLKPVLTSQVVMLVGMIVLVSGLGLTGDLHWTVALVPALWLGQILALSGINWVLSLLNVVFRDLQNLISAILMILLVGSPIAYTPSMVPEQLQSLVNLNPFAYYVIGYQKLLVLGELPSPLQAGVIAGLSLGLFTLGSWFFPRAKRVLIDYV
ncbi:MAG TPA: ABC transporter permease [Candidatus Dormibacteraeota bacterium]|nr:ABC transporter permease [Candidatus Dormibacteraeota bacterium]